MYGRRRAWLVFAIPVALAATACSDGGTTAERGEESSAAYGDPDATSTTITPADAASAPTTTAPPSAAAPANPAPTSAPAASIKNVANRTERLDPSGFFLVLVAGGATRFKTSDRVAFELTFENRSDHTLVHDSNQQLRFALYRKLGGTKTEQAWSNYGCRPSKIDKPLTGILEIEPGERGSFVDYYPTKDESDAAGEGCRVTPGAYLLVGVLDWCPPESLKRSEYNGAPYCDKDKVQHLQSAPLALTFV